MSTEKGVRGLEEGITTDFSHSMDYASYLHLDVLLAGRSTRSAPPRRAAVHHPAPDQ